jgi:hypothetical protein
LAFSTQSSSASIQPESAGRFPWNAGTPEITDRFRRPGHGIGGAVTEKPDRIVEYAGNKIAVSR